MTAPIVWSYLYLHWCDADRGPARVFPGQLWERLAEYAENHS